MSSAIEKAVEILNAGGVVGMPTETVYGLAARVDMPEGLNKIFSIKNRPFFDPLIVHVSDAEQAKFIVAEWSQITEHLSAAFWPGPLTLVLPKNSLVSDLITSGLSTVGVRCPRHQVAQELINKVGVPLAAPSANKFGRTSPTCSQHVRDEFGDEVFVLEGGSSEVGIESTILSVENHTLKILRPGVISVSEIESCLNKVGVNFDWHEKSQNSLSVSAPGMLKHHYMPNRPLVLVSEAHPERYLASQIDLQLSQLPHEVEGVSLIRPKAVRRIFELKLSEEPILAARELYSKLRLAAESGADVIVLVWPKHKRIGEWTAVWDRLSKAASLDLL